jgi:hypothetical protein
LSDNLVNIKSLTIYEKFMEKALTTLCERYTMSTVDKDVARATQIDRRKNYEEKQCLQCSLL